MSKSVMFSALCVMLFANTAAAQTDVGVSASALVSMQPIDDSYVGGPYLSDGIGGFGPGASAGISILASSGLVLAGEFSTARFEKEQAGRLVRGGYPLEDVPATTRLHDSLLSAFIGYATRGSPRVVLLGGISARLDRPTIDDVEAEQYENDEGVAPAFTGGVDVLAPLSSRAQLVIGARYTYNQRDTRQQYLGIGADILRVGVGVRVRLN
jgi:hypothetical protein